MTSEERREARYQRRKAKRDEARLRRSKECDDFDEVFSFRHLYLSGKKCCKGVYWKNSTQRYIGNIIPIIAKTHRELQNGTFKHRGFHAFTIMERGKKRYIRSVHITERAVQKCLCDYCLVPIYSACFIYDNSASLKHRGMDFALRRMTFIFNGITESTVWKEGFCFTIFTASLTQLHTSRCSVKPTADFMTRKSESLRTALLRTSVLWDWVLAVRYLRQTPSCFPI